MGVDLRETKSWLLGFLQGANAPDYQIEKVATLLGAVDYLTEYRTPQEVSFVEAIAVLDRLLARLYVKGKSLDAGDLLDFGGALGTLKLAKGICPHEPRD